MCSWFCKLARLGAFSNDFLLAGGFCFQGEADDDLFADQIVFFAGVADAEVVAVDVELGHDLDGFVRGGGLGGEGDVLGDAVEGEIA